MQITHNGKTYGVTPYLYGIIKNRIIDGDLELITKPEQNLEEAFAEDFPNTWGKPEEKPTWFVETSEMKKSEYCEVFKEWFIKASGGNENSWSWTCERYGFGGSRYMNGYEGDSFEWDERKDFTKLSPQQWYDTIYDGEKLILTQEEAEKIAKNLRKMVSENPDHDKAMEIPEVSSFFSSELSEGHNEWNHKVRDTLNLLIKAHNNK